MRRFGTMNLARVEPAVRAAVPAVRAERVERAGSEAERVEAAQAEPGACEENHATTIS